MSQEPNGNCTEKLVQMSIFISGGFFRVHFPPLRGDTRHTLLVTKWSGARTWSVPPKHPKLRPWSEFSRPRNLDHDLSFSFPWQIQSLGWSEFWLDHDLRFVRGVRSTGVEVDERALNYVFRGIANYCCYTPSCPTKKAQFAAKGLCKERGMTFCSGVLGVSHCRGYRMRLDRKSGYSVPLYPDTPAF